MLARRILSTGFPILGPYGNGEPDLSAGASSMMLNNLWG